MKFTKKEFEENYLSKEKNNKNVDEDIDEIFEPEGDFGGDKPELSSVSQISTNTQKSFDDESEYEEDIPTTGDDYATMAKNRLSRFHPFGPNMGNPWGIGGMYGVRENEEAKGKMEDLIKELLNNYTSSREIVDKSSPEDINNNNIMDIDEINKPEVITTMNKFISSISGSELTDDELGTVIFHTLKSLNDNVNLKKMSTLIKYEIKKIIT
tara:strand:- start:3537 stop:4169 length:633 start_codon:yes stop_codon:yes gene_type:complete